MRLSDLGERRIIELFEKNLKKCEEAVVGIGDDACILELDGENCLVVSTDLISQKEHIPREMTPRQMGRYVVNINLSDLASMGAKPLGMVFSFGLPGELDEDFIKGLSKGIREACEEHGACVLGGDTKEHREVVIAGTAIGKVKKGEFLTRSGAEAGDLICVTGTIGSAAAGFYCLTRNIKEEKFIKAALEPRARVEEGMILAKYASACMDISDGLAFTLHEVARASGVGFLVYEDRVPVDRDVERVSKATGISVGEMVFHKGGDYELLFTLNPQKLDRLKKEMQGRTEITTIGEITKEGGRVKRRDGVEEELEPRGYESFVTRF
jgi:thiamine-monophosphate kinase